MRVRGIYRVLFGSAIGLSGMVLAAPVSPLTAGASSTVTVYAPATLGVVSPTTGPTAAAPGQRAQRPPWLPRSWKTSTGPVATTAARPTSIKSSSRRTKGCASATAT